MIFFLIYTVTFVLISLCVSSVPVLCFPLIVYCCQITTDEINQPITLYFFTSLRLMKVKLSSAKKSTGHFFHYKPEKLLLVDYII